MKKKNSACLIRDIIFLCEFFDYLVERFTFLAEYKKKVFVQSFVARLFDSFFLMCNIFC